MTKKHTENRKKFRIIESNLKMKPTKNQLFKRQITLSEIGEVGQIKLQNASVLVVGCGGLGSPIAVYLAASGIGKIHLIDFGWMSIENDWSCRQGFDSRIKPCHLFHDNTAL